MLPMPLAALTLKDFDLPPQIPPMLPLRPGAVFWWWKVELLAEPLLTLLIPVCPDPNPNSGGRAMSAEVPLLVSLLIVPSVIPMLWRHLPVNPPLLWPPQYVCLTCFLNLQFWSCTILQQAGQAWPPPCPESASNPPHLVAPTQLLSWRFGQDQYIWQWLRSQQVSRHLSCSYCVPAEC